MIMNDFEREDLHFILKLDECGWEEFLGQSSNEDLLYALRLVVTAQAEQITSIMELQDALDTECGLDCTEAMKVINRVKQGVSK
jgi:hypothetical protein